MSSLAVDGRFVFVYRARSLRLKLHEEWKMLQHMDEGARIYGPFASSIGLEISGLVAELDSILESVQSNGHELLPHSRLDRAQSNATSLFGEVLALRMVGSIRGSLDDGMCRIADAFLQELGRLVAFEVPHLSTVADGEYYGVSSRVIRLRYPSRSLWDLPILGHEFGHSFGPSWRSKLQIDGHPQEAFLRNSALGSKSINEEYFCDLLATFLLGPAYPATCILERFNPSAQSDSDTHPCDSKRAWWILKALELLADSIKDSDESAVFRSYLEYLKNCWKDYGGGTGAHAFSDEEIDIMELAAVDLFSKFESGLTGSAYSSSGNAWGLAANFSEGKTTGNPLKIRDILNASWFLRWQHGDTAERIAEIEKWGLDLARSIVG